MGSSISIDVKWLFHLVQGLVILLAYPAVTSLWRNVKKGTFGLYIKLYMSLALLPVLIGVVGLFLGFDEFFTLFHEALFPGIAVGSLIPCWTRLSTFCQKSISFSVLSFFFLVYEGIMVSLTWLARKQLKMYLKNKE